MDGAEGRGRGRRIYVVGDVPWGLEVGMSEEEGVHSEEEVARLCLAWEGNGAKMSLEFPVGLAVRVFSD